MDMDDIAQQEYDRLWGMRQQLPSVNEITEPILRQYCMCYSRCRDLAIKIQTADATELQSHIDALAKLQKVADTYAKTLKLTEQIATVKKSKFYDLLIDQ